MAALQEGIYYRRGQRPGRFFAILFLRAAPGSDGQEVGTCFAELWAMYQELKEGRIRDLDGVVLPHDHDQLSVLAGLGRNAFKLDGIGLEKPEGLGDQHLFRSPLPDGGGPLLIGSGLSYAPDARANLATEELCVQAIADTKLAVDRVIVETWKLLSDRVDPATGAAPLQLTTFYLGAQRSDHRSWIDFHDGLSNMRSEDREQAIAIEAGTDVDWAVGGTYLAFLRLAVDLPLWRTLDRTSQELVVGRDKLTGCPLTGLEGETPKSDPGCPVGGTQIWEEANDESFSEPPSADDARIRQSHVQRANHHQEPPSDAGTRRIFRQGYEFLEWKDSSPGFRPGLNFVSFQDTPQRLLRMLTAEGWLGQVNFGGDPDDEPKSLLTTYAAAIYFVPPLRDSELFPGARALGLTDLAEAPGSDR
jgi:deferrochelatase/peroxidase EfeB